MTVPSTLYDTDQIATELGNVSTTGAYSSDDLFDSTEIDDFDLMPNASNAADLKSEPNDTDKFRGYVNFHPAFVLGKSICNLISNYKLPASDWQLSNYSYANSNCFAYDAANKIICWGTYTTGGSNVLPMWKVSNDYSTREIVVIENNSSSWVTSCVKFVNGYLMVCSHDSNNNSLRINYCPVQSTLAGYDNYSNWSRITYSTLVVSGPIMDILYYSGRYYYVTALGEVGSVNSSFSDGKQHLDLDRFFMKCSILGTRFIAWDEGDDNAWCYLSVLPNSGGGDWTTFDAQENRETPVYAVVEAQGYNFILTQDNYLYRVSSVSSFATLIATDATAIGLYNGYLLVRYTGGYLYQTSYTGTGGTLLGTILAIWGETIFEY